MASVKQVKFKEAVVCNGTSFGIYNKLPTDPLWGIDADLTNWVRIYHKLTGVYTFIPIENVACIEFNP